jgi:transposase
MDVAIGVDSHKATLEVAALDAVGKHLATKRFRNDPRGLDEILAWVRSFPAKRVVGIECSATFGAALARHLLSSGEDVREVPGNLSHAEAKLTGKGKSDPTDAQAIARIVLRRPSLPPAGDGFNEDLKLLSDQRKKAGSKGWLLAARARARAGGTEGETESRRRQRRSPHRKAQAKR